MILYYVDHIFLGVIVYFMNFFFFEKPQVIQRPVKGCMLQILN